MNLAPVPASIKIQQAHLPTGMQVLMIVEDVTGSKGTFIAPEAAVQIGTQLVAAGRAGNIILPAGVSMPVEVPEELQAAADELAARHQQPQNRQQRRAAERAAAKERREPGVYGEA